MLRQACPNLVCLSFEIISVPDYPFWEGFIPGANIDNNYVLQHVFA